MSRAVSGFWGARKRGRALANESGESFLSAFSRGYYGRQFWRHFARAISRGQFRAGNFVRAISRPCVVLPAAGACRLPPASRIACEWGAVFVAAAEVAVAVVLAVVLVVVSSARMVLTARGPAPAPLGGLPGVSIPP